MRATSLIVTSARLRVLTVSRVYDVGVDAVVDADADSDAGAGAVDLRLLQYCHWRLR